MDVEVLEVSAEELLHRDVVERRGARSSPQRIGLYLREGPLDLLSGCTLVLCVLVAFFMVVSPFLSSGTGARVDVGQVCHLGLGQAAEGQLDTHPVTGGLRDGSAARGVRAVLGLELHLGRVAHPLAQHLLHLHNLHSLRLLYGLRKLANFWTVGALEDGFGHGDGGSVAEIGSSHMVSHPCIIPIWACWVRAMSAAIVRIASLCVLSRTISAIWTAWAWWTIMSRAKPASGESSAGGLEANISASAAPAARRETRVSRTRGISLARYEEGVLCRVGAIRIF